PLASGAVADAASLSVVDAAGAPVPAQTWPLATWPDGSVKWAGVALGAGGEPAEGYRVVAGDAAEPRARVTVSPVEDGVVVDTGACRVTVAATGPDLVRSVRVDGTEVAASGRLVSSRQDRPEADVRGRVHA